MSPVAKKCSVDRPIRTESTESVSDWANRMGAKGFFPILNTEAWWENTEIRLYSRTTSLTNGCVWVSWHFFQIKYKRLLIFTPKLPNAALIVAKICFGGRISYILTSCIPYISAQNNKHFTCWLLNRKLPAAGKNT